MKQLRFRTYLDGIGFKYFNIGEEVSISTKNGVNQFTGLLDKQGVEIYEGDIVKDGASDTGRLWEISLTYEIGIKFTLLKDRGVVYSYQYFNIFHKKSLEVIGNIYENPELLEVE